jgi:hypothetical protein
VTVADLIERLQTMPGHWPVYIEDTADGSGGGAEVVYRYTLDCERGNFPTQGGMAVITINHDPS